MLKKLKKLTEEQVIKIIDKVCKRSMNKHCIPGMDADDVYQESFILCAEALERYDEKKPLENFLAYNLCRRIKNTYRKLKIKQIDTVSIEEIDPDFLTTESEENIEEFLIYINDRMSLYERQDYIKYIHNVPIPRIRRTKLLQKLKKYAETFNEKQNDG